MTRDMTTKLLTSLAACLGFIPCFLSASITLGTYTFDDTISASNTADHLTLSDFGIGSGVTGTFPDYSGLAVSGKSNLFYNAGFNSTDEAGAVGTNRYIGFSSEVDGGYFVDYTSMSFYSLRRTGGGEDHGLGAPSGYALYVSVNDFNTAVATGSIEGNQVDNTFSLNSIDLSNVAFLQSVTDTVEFRLYLWAGDGLATPGQRQLRIDDFTLSGDVSVIPEPAAYAYIGMAAFAFVFWRRFRTRG